MYLGRLLVICYSVALNNPKGSTVLDYLHYHFIGYWVLGRDVHKTYLDRYLGSQTAPKAIDFQGLGLY
jgi:hypothetical protein